MVKNPLTEIYNNHDQLANYKVRWIMSRVWVVSTWRFYTANLLSSKPPTNLPQVVLDLGNAVFSPFSQAKCPALAAEFSDLPSELIFRLANDEWDDDFALC